jgi:hypothetical protein
MPSPPKPTVKSYRTKAAGAWRTPVPGGTILGYDGITIPRAR